MRSIQQQIRLSLLRALIAVDDTGSIRGAARSLGLTQPALTKNIAQLEALIGSPIVQRRPPADEPDIRPQALARSFWFSFRYLLGGDCRRI